MDIPGRKINPDESLITDPFPRGGDGMILRVQLLAKGGSSGTALTVVVYTRNYEDNTGWNTITGASLSVPTSTTVGDILELHVPSSSTAGAGIEEELRLKITGGDTAWMTIRVFPPVFYDAAIGTV